MGLVAELTPASCCGRCKAEAGRSAGCAKGVREKHKDKQSVRHQEVMGTRRPARK